MVVNSSSGEDAKQATSAAADAADADVDADDAAAERTTDRPVVSPSRNGKLAVSKEQLMKLTAEKAGP
jgi:hypothetical protein